MERTHFSSSPCALTTRTSLFPKLLPSQLLRPHCPIYPCLSEDPSFCPHVTMVVTSLTCNSYPGCISESPVEATGPWTSAVLPSPSLFPLLSIVAQFPLGDLLTLSPCGFDGVDPIPGSRECELTDFAGYSNQASAGRVAQGRLMRIRLERLGMDNFLCEGLSERIAAAAGGILPLILKIPLENENNSGGRPRWRRF